MNRDRAGARCERGAPGAFDSDAVIAMELRACRPAGRRLEIPFQPFLPRRSRGGGVGQMYKLLGAISQGQTDPSWHLGWGHGRPRHVTCPSEPGRVPPGRLL